MKDKNLEVLWLSGYFYKKICATMCSQVMLWPVYMRYRYHWGNKMNVYKYACFRCLLKWICIKIGIVLRSCVPTQ